MFGKTGHDHLKVVIADLSRDAKEMLAEGCSPRYVSFRTLWRAACAVVPILWDATMRVLRKVAGAAELIRRITGQK